MKSLGLKLPALSASEWVLPSFAIGSLLFSALFAAYSLKQLRSASEDAAFWRGAVPKVSVAALPFDANAYAGLPERVIKRDKVAVEVVGDRIKVRGTDLQALSAWKSSVSDIMALHPELVVKTVCAGASTCQGGALVAELTGGRLNVTVSE